MQVPTGQVVSGRWPRGRWPASLRPLQPRARILGDFRVLSGLPQVRLLIGAEGHPDPEAHPSFHLLFPSSTLSRPALQLQSILEQFNPALENLVYLGNNYLRAFHGECPAPPM